MTLMIGERLPGLNDYISAMNRSAYIGNKMKQETQEIIGAYILKAKARYLIGPVKEYPVRIDFTWYEKSRKRDLDNIASAKKFILDALQTYGILAGDGQKYVADINDIFCIPSKYSGCDVEIYGI